MQAVIALVGRPNVGKSTLFNQLTRRRDALVFDYPGLTRDRQYGLAQLGERSVVLIDTGGIEAKTEDGLDEHVQAQTRQALDEADVLVWLTDGREGLMPEDHEIARSLRVLGKPVVLAVNKIDGVVVVQALADLHALGFGSPLPIAAAH